METMDTGEMWRAVSAVTFSEMWESVKLAGREILEYNPEATELSDVFDDVTEQADSLIPVYYSEQVREWYALGSREPEDSGLSDGSTFGNITASLFEWYHDQLSRVVSDMLAERVEMLGAVS